MSKLFESTTINGMDLSNRFVRSATWESMATSDGAVTPELIKTMVALARGGVGLIISGHTYVRPEGQASPRQLSICKDEFISGLQAMTSTVHEHGSKIVMQIAHAGNFVDEQSVKQPPLVVSDFEGLATSARKEMTKQDIRDIVNAFADAAQRAKLSGFDGVQIHAAHGYLLSQFLSPVFNRRQDEYGGNVYNRSRIHLEVHKAIRKLVGENYPVLIKMNCQDFVEKGLSLQDAIQVAKLLTNDGFDAIELSGGILTNRKLVPSRRGINSREEEAYHKEEAAFFKKEISVPLMLVGGIRSFEVAEELVEKKIADYISMSRPFIREADLINRWKVGDFRKAECKSDNLCFRPRFKGEGIYCISKESGL